MQKFLNLKNLQYVKNTKFSKFSQNLSFFQETLTCKEKIATNYIKNHKKYCAGIGEPIVPNRDMTRCFRKYLPTKCGGGSSPG
jgi:hypothetical protein